MTPSETFAACGFYLTPGHFSTQDWESINAIDANGRLISKLIKPVLFLTSDGRLFEIPDHQPTDYASAPPILWGAPLYLIPYGWWSLPAAGHDSAFQNLLLEHFDDSPISYRAKLTENQCNDLLDEMMDAIKPNPTPFEILQRDAIVSGVTLGGWHAFKEDRS
jgi:hypothetical protein